MTVCAMCRKHFQTDSGKKGICIAGNKQICEDCSKQIDALVNSNNQSEVDKAINYIRSCQTQTPDAEVILYLEELIENRTSTFDDTSKTKEQPKVSEPKEVPQEDKLRPLQTQNLEEILENNASAVDGIKKTQNSQRKSGPVQFSSDTNYFREKEAEEEANGLFGNVGGKIKGTTTVCCWIGIICCVLTGLVMLFSGAVIAGLLYGVVGSLMCWLVSLTTYAFGELLVVTQKNNQLLAEILKATKSQKTKE